MNAVSSPFKNLYLSNVVLNVTTFFFTDYIARAYNRAFYVECIFRRILNHYRRI